MPLDAEPNVLSTAWIHTPTGAYIAKSSRSAVCALIESIYHAESLQTISHARSLLRNRIYSSTEPTYVERETVKVAAKRIVYSKDPPPTGAIELPEAPAAANFGARWKNAEITPGRSVRREEIPEFLANLAELPALRPERWISDRPVSTALLDSHGRVLAHAWNTNAVIRTRHAEWNLCERLQRDRKKIPAGSTLYVSLKPCRMCAARIWDIAEDPAQFAVVYLEDDPGPLAQQTMLDTGSLARRRFLRPRHALFGHPVQSIYNATRLT